LRYPEFITVAEDIEYLRREWNTEVRGDTLRRGSVTLRLLLVEGLLGRAWRAVGLPRQPAIPAVDLEQHLSGVTHPIVAALAGGGSVDGVDAACAVMVKGDSLGRNGPDIGPTVRDFALSDYVESTAVVAADVRIRRREVIKYFANIKGGAHLALSSRTRQREEELIRRVGRVEGSIQVIRFEGLYFELLSIGQAVAHAPDMQKLIDAICD
jgi:hypothetical protein